MMLAVALVAGCSRGNPRYGATGAGDKGGGGDGDSGETPTGGLGTTAFGGEGSTTDDPPATGGSDTVGATDEGTTTLDSATGSGGPELCQGLREIRVSTSPVVQVPSGVRLATRSAVVFREDAGPLVAAVFGEPAAPEFHPLPGTEAVTDAWLAGAGPAGVSVLGQGASGVTLQDFGGNFDVVGQSSIGALGDVTHSVLYEVGVGMLFPLLDGASASMHAALGAAADPEPVEVADNVLWVAGSGGGTAAVIVYQVDITPSCRAFHVVDIANPGSDSVVAPTCRFPTVAYHHSFGGIVAYHTGDGPAAEIRGQVIDEDANPAPLIGNKSGNFAIADGEGVGYADITRLPSGNFWVVWATNGGLQAALLDGVDPSMPVYVTPEFAVGADVSFNKRTFSIGPHGAVTFHRSDGGDTGVYVVVDCDSI